MPCSACLVRFLVLSQKHLAYLFSCWCTPSARPSVSAEWNSVESNTQGSDATGSDKGADDGGAGAGKDGGKGGRSSHAAAAAGGGSYRQRAETSGNTVHVQFEGEQVCDFVKGMVCLAALLRVLCCCVRFSPTPPGLSLLRLLGGYGCAAAAAPAASVFPSMSRPRHCRALGMKHVASTPSPNVVDHHRPAPGSSRMNMLVFSRCPRFPPRPSALTRKSTESGVRG